MLTPSNIKRVYSILVSYCTSLVCSVQIKEIRLLFPRILLTVNDNCKL